jgi:hypothetical protein
MVGILARSAIGILAVTASLSNGFACGSEETWLTDEEIAIAKAGGDVPWRNLSPQYIEPTLPDIPFVSPIVVEGADKPDVIVDARSQLFAVADQPFDVPSAKIEHLEPMYEQESVSLPNERSNLKRVVIACDGGMLVSPNVL